jgi:hypothetical protein
MRFQRRASAWRGGVEHLERRDLLALLMTANNISAVAQTPFSGAVAAVFDTTLADKASDFNTPPGSVQITWGDGSNPTSGQAVATFVPGLFEIDGDHTYTNGGQFSIGIKVVDHKSESADKKNGAANVTVSPMTQVANTLSGTAGQPLNNVTVASFFDPNTSDTKANFNALIAWGDGNITSGTVLGGKGVFTVTGSNTYVAPNTYTTTVTIVNVGNGQITSQSGQAKIAPAPPFYKMTGKSIVTPAGQPLTKVTVATFTDPHLNDTRADFTALIDWNDGHTGPGVVSGSNGNFVITGTYTYPVPGT